MSQIISLFIQLILITGWAIINDYGQHPTYMDTARMKAQGNPQAKVTLVAHFDPSTAVGQSFQKQLSQITPQYIDTGLICYYEETDNQGPLCIYINGIERTCQVLNSTLSFCLSKELYKEIL